MSLLQRSAIVTAMLAALSVPAFAQPSPADAPAAATAQSAPSGKHHRPDPQARKARMEQRMQALKTALKLNASQEGAWNSYVAALQPPMYGERPAHPDRKAIAAMTTPERIDAMQAMHAKHQAAMDQRNQATKTFYAALTPEQQKTFDAETLKMHDRRGPGGEGQHERRGHRQGAKAEQTVPATDSK